MGILNQYLKQRFRKFDLVYVEVTSPMKSHFKSGFYGIVAYSYRDRYGGTNNKEYSVIALNKKLTKVVNQICWYDVSELKLSDKLSKREILAILKDLKWIDI